MTRQLVVPGSFEGEDIEQYWTLKISKLCGQSYLRPEKSWKPVLTIEVEELDLGVATTTSSAGGVGTGLSASVQKCHQQMELSLGVNGENPNMKLSFLLYNIISSKRSRIHFKIWKKVESKKKTISIAATNHGGEKNRRGRGGARRKQVLVATAQHCLHDIIKLQQGGGSHDNKFAQIRLNAQTTSGRRDRKGSAGSTRASGSSGGGGRAQNGAYLHVRLTPPPDFSGSIASSSPSSSFLTPISVDNDGGDDDDDDGAGASSSTSSLPPTPTGFTDVGDDEEQREWMSFQHRTEEEWEGLRRRVKPYSIDEDEGPPPSYQDYNPEEETEKKENGGSGGPWSISNPLGYFISSSILPTTIRRDEKLDSMESVNDEEDELSTLSSSPSLWWWERVISTFSLYRNFKYARSESEYQVLHDAIRNEWSFAGGALAAICGISTAVFTLTPDTLFPANSLARSALAMAGLISAVGILMVFWFWLRFHWADFETFNYRALDLYGTYFFFSLTSKIPLLSAILSTLCLLTFIFNVAYTVWPIGSLVTCFFFGFLLTLQFFIFGIHWVGVRIALGIRWVVLRFSLLLGFGRQKETKNAVGGDGPPSFSPPSSSPSVKVAPSARSPN